MTDLYSTTIFQVLTTVFSVLGIIAIPGMMTGAILGGSSVQQAAKLQMIIMFMISASTVLGSIFTTLAVIYVTVDGQHRIRSDRIEEGAHPVWRISQWGFGGLGTKIRSGCKRMYYAVRRNGGNRDEDRQGLII